MIVIFDTNVFVSAIRTPGGPPDRLLRCVQEGDVDLVVSPLLAELRRILLAKCGDRLSEEETGRFLAELVVIGRLEPDPPADRRQLTRDPDDDFLVRLARSVGADLLVSGDKDLLHAELLSPVVATPTGAVARLGL